MISMGVVEIIVVFVLIEWICLLEVFCQVYCEQLGIECEDVGCQFGIVVVGEGVGDWCVVGDVFDVELDCQIVCWMCYCQGQVEIVLCVQLIIGGVVDMGVVCILVVIVVVQCNCLVVDRYGILVVDIYCIMWCVGQFVVGQVGGEIVFVIGFVGQWIILVCVEQVIVVDVGCQCVGLIVVVMCSIVECGECCYCGCGLGFGVLDYGFDQVVWVDVV